MFSAVPGFDLNPFDFNKVKLSKSMCIQRTSTPMKVIQFGSSIFTCHHDCFFSACIHLLSLLWCHLSIFLYGISAVYCLFWALDVFGLVGNGVCERPLKTEILNK